MENLKELLEGVEITIDNEIQHLTKINDTLKNSKITEAINLLMEIRRACLADLEPLEK